MPRKASGEQNNEKLTFSLPPGALALLEQVVGQGELGGSRSEVIRSLVQAQLLLLVEKGHIVRTAVSSPSMPGGSESGDKQGSG